MEIIYYLGWGFFWFVILGAITSAVAKSRGHEPVPWFFFGGLLFIIALPLALLLPAPGAGRNAPARGCPYCGAKLNSGVMQCPECGRGQPQTATTNQQAWERTLSATDEVEKWARQNPPPE